MAPLKKYHECLGPDMMQECHNDLDQCEHKCHVFRRVRYRRRKPTIAELVYQFLGNMALKRKKGALKNFKRTHVWRSGHRKRRSDTGDDLETRKAVTIVRKDSSGSIRRKRKASDRGKSRSRGMSSIRGTKRYFDSAVEKGKQRAKRYVRKALFFGLDSGFLISEDPNCQVLRVTSSLLNIEDPKDRKRLHSYVRRENVNKSEENEVYESRKSRKMRGKRGRSRASSKDSLRTKRKKRRLKSHRRIMKKQRDSRSKMKTEVERRKRKYFSRSNSKEDPEEPDKDNEKGDNNAGGNTDLQDIKKTEKDSQTLTLTLPDVNSNEKKKKGGSDASIAEEDSEDDDKKK